MLSYGISQRACKRDGGLLWSKLHIVLSVPIQKRAEKNHRITNKIMAMQGSIAVVRAEIDTSRNDGKNCCATRNVLTLVTPLCKGCKIMLLDYKVVKGKL